MIITAVTTHTEPIITTTIITEATEAHTTIIKTITEIMVATIRIATIRITNTVITIIITIMVTMEEAIIILMEVTIRITELMETTVVGEFHLLTIKYSFLSKFKLISGMNDKINYTLNI